MKRTMRMVKVKIMIQMTMEKARKRRRNKGNYQKCLLDLMESQRSVSNNDLRLQILKKSVFKKHNITNKINEFQ